MGVTGGLLGLVFGISRMVQLKVCRRRIPGMVLRPDSQQAIPGMVLFNTLTMGLHSFILTYFSCMMDMWFPVRGPMATVCETIAVTVSVLVMAAIHATPLKRSISRKTWEEFRRDALKVGPRLLNISLNLYFIHKMCALALDRSGDTKRDQKDLAAAFFWILSPVVATEIYCLFTSESCSLPVLKERDFPLRLPNRSFVFIDIFQIIFELAALNKVTSDGDDFFIVFINIASTMISDD